MSNFLARCAAIGLVGGGFAATGDLGWLAARGLQVVNARTVPAERPPADPIGEHSPAAAPAMPVPPATAAPAPTSPGTAAVDPFRSPPAGRPATPLADDPPPPSAGPDHVDLAALRPGERVTVWVGSGAAGRRSIAFDLVTPTAGEALLLAAGMPPRRVTVRAARAATGIILAKGGGVVIAPVGPAHHGQPSGETVGPITALAVGRQP